MKTRMFLLSALLFFILSNISYTQDCADSANIYTFTYDGRTYEIVKENKTWADAAACAVERGGVLAEIDSQEEQDTLYNHLLIANIIVSNTVAPDGGGASYVWIGGNDITTEGEWIWDGDNDGEGIQFWEGTTSGGPVDSLYNNWGNEPDNWNNQDGLGLAITDWPLGVAGQWNDVDDTNTLYFIVEYERQFGSNVILVPYDQPTIQAAINTSVDGDTVLVADGLYYENINFKGKAITVASWFLVDGDESHIDSTIINGSKPNNPDSASVVRFLSGEDSTSVIFGFTITGGKGTINRDNFHYGGGGIAVGSGAKIQYNKIIMNVVTHTCPVAGGIGVGEPTNPVIITNNYIGYNEAISSNCTNGAGGIGIREDIGAYVLVANNVIVNNRVYSPAGPGGGGGIMIQYSTSVIRNNIIAKNESYRGAGIDVWDGRHPLKPTILNNTIINNIATNNGGGINADYDNPSENPIRNCIIWGNTAPIGPQISNIGGGSPGIYDIPIEYSVIEGGYEGTGNIDTDPIFADTTLYYLSSSSPCVDAGHPSILFNDIEDSENPGFPLFPALGGLRNDMGAYGGNPRMVILHHEVVKNCKINNSYLRPGQDTLVVSSKIASPNNQPVEVKAFIENSESVSIDSLSMYDDGHKYDAISGDGIFNGYLVCNEIEDIYSVHVKVYLTEYNLFTRNYNAVSFTTAGPVIWKNYVITQQNDSAYSMKVTLENKSSNFTIPDISARLSTNDSNVTEIISGSYNPQNYPDIEPGQFVQSSGKYGYAFYVKNNPTELEFQLEISSNGHPFWYDTVVVNLNLTNIQNSRLNIPIAFELMQNYPNPFNPSTTINYSIPKQNKVTLKVYDALGSEVATIVNKVQSQGNYEIEFDGSELTSGIYFYKLQAGEFVETKKMVLVK